MERRNCTGTALDLSKEALKIAKTNAKIQHIQNRIKFVNSDIDKYFARPVLQMILRQPFQVTGVDGQFDVNATVKGGGLSGQAGAVKHGISKALQLYDPSLRSSLKASGFLTRDSRVVERKKYGKRKARRSFQFSKR